MSNLKFQALQENHSFDQNKTFKWNIASVSNWLQNLSVDDAELDISCQQIAYTLQALSNANLNKKNHLAILHSLSEYLKIFEERIDAIYLDSSIPLSKKNEGMVQHLYHCYLAQADNFFIIAESNEKENANFIIHGILKLIEAFRIASSIYCAPCDQFWPTFWNFFKLIDQTEVSSQMQAHLDHKPTPINLIKAFLLFSISDFTQFRPREQQTLSKLIIKHACLLAVSIAPPSTETKRAFVVEINQNYPPKDIRIKKASKQNGYTYYLDTSELIKSLRLELHKANLQVGAFNEAQQQIIKKLLTAVGEKKNRKFQRTEEHSSLTAIVGYLNIENYLRQNLNPDELPQSDDKLEETQQEHLSHKVKYEHSEFDLVENDERVVYNFNIETRNDSKSRDDTQRIYGLSNRNNIWNSNKAIQQIIDIELGDFKILNSSIGGYALNFGQYKAKLKIGEVIAFVAINNRKVEIGIIKRISRHTQDQYHIGVEKLGKAEVIVSLTHQLKPEKQAWAILIPGAQLTNKPDSILFSSSEFNLGDQIIVQSGADKIECRLARYVNQTASAKHAELGNILD